MNRFCRAHWIAAACALLCLESTTVPAADASSAAVEFAPGYEAAVQAEYGTREAPALRTDVVLALSEALTSSRGGCTLKVDVVIDRVSPSHPTIKQQLDNPAMDPIRTVFLNGGAALTGHVRSTDGRTLETVHFQRFADDRRFVSAGKDPWSDARVAIGQFATQVAGACKKHSEAAGSPPA